MKKILVIGKNSYIGNHFVQFAKKHKFTVDVIDSHDECRTKQFSGYDSVLFVAGVAHQKQTAANKDSYFKINRDLATTAAQKAKHDGVKQFVYISSMAVYGLKEGVVNAETPLAPGADDYYGQSKLQAELNILAISDDDFHCVAVRPPMVFGPNCPGKFKDLLEVSKKLRIVPDTKNKRSMIYIDNLCGALLTLIKQNAEGIYCPHNAKYINTAEMIKEIRDLVGLKTSLVSAAGGVTKAIGKLSPIIQTAFGSLYYDGLACPNDYPVVDYQEAIKKSAAY